MLESIFMSVLTVSVTTGVIIAAINIFSSRLNRSFVSKWKYWIWLILAVRLLIPFNLSFSQAPVQISVPDTPVINTAPVTQTQLPTTPNPTPTAPITANLRPVATNTGLSAIELIACIWLIGAIVFLIWHLIAYLRCKRQALRWSNAPEKPAVVVILEQLCAEMEISKNVTLLISRNVSSPMMIGFIKSYLLLPHEEYADSDLIYILRHELVHLKRRDIWYKSLMLLANAVHWFNPAAYLLLREAGRDLELACDDEVIRGLSFDERGEYSDTIMRTVSSQRFHNTVLSTYFYGGTKMMKERFANILGKHKKRNGIVLGAVILVCAAIIGSLVALNSTRVIDPSEYNAIYNKYMRAPCLGMVTSTTWNDPNEVDPDDFINYYADSFTQSGGKFELAADNGMYIPQDELEAFVQSHFDVSIEHLRTAQYYYPEMEAYEFGGLGSAVDWVITSAEQKGKQLTINFHVVGWYVYHRGSTVIEVNGENYKYVSNKREQTVQLTLDFPSSSFISDENGVLTVESGGMSSTSSDGVNWKSYDGGTLSSILGFYWMEALPELGAIEETSESLEDGWRWTGTYGDGIPLVINVQRAYGKETYIITILYEENASIAGRGIVDTVRLDWLDNLSIDYVSKPFAAGILDTTWSVPFNIHDKGSIVRFYALMENKDGELRYPTADVDAFMEEYLDEDDLNMIRYSIWYDEESDTYFSDTGFTDRPWCWVTSAERDGDKLILHYKVTEPEDDGDLLWEGELTVILSEQGYKYSSNYMRYPLYPVTQDAEYLNEITETYIFPMMPAYGILWQSWESPMEIPADDLVNFCAFNNLLNLPKQPDFDESFVNNHAPAEEAEAAIKRYFDVPAEYLRTSRWYNFTDASNGESYDNEYIMLYGFGGGGWTNALNVEQDGDLLRITVGLYGPDDEDRRPRTTSLLTIRLGSNGAYMYQSNIIAGE